ncbi:MAG: PilT/PilU family type 4a pilus ATPase [Deltaproteobacteria bacterium]|nr:MAG: PilT/PilU family type 4a pilus ATPase [Deltaproteobacteria bacterium]
MKLIDVLAAARFAGASDIHFKRGIPPIFRIDGALAPCPEAGRLSDAEMTAFIREVVPESKRKRFEEELELNTSFVRPRLGRFRVTLFRQRGEVGMIMRLIPNRIETLRDLNLPEVTEQIAMERRGLILITGATGSGKSTTLAAFLDHINTHRTCHIVTIEDPVEFTIREKRSLITQREVGVDTHAFPVALRQALRQDTDVIMVGEIRERETMELVLQGAETGHLVLSTLHTTDAQETIHRVVSFFPATQQEQIRIQLASVLKAIVAQRLISRSDGKGRLPAVEILIANEQIRELIRNPMRTSEIPQAIFNGHVSYGMQTFDQSIMHLLERKLIDEGEAMRYVRSTQDFSMRLKGIETADDGNWSI